ncbi:MAG: hypothetical protein K6G12_09825 [Lachnospiraceae bacterium]|nr:hypothetical protein [Lachnospiraceae bacterium]
MFTDRLNEIMILSGAKNRQIAENAGYDPSTLTHLRKGKRTPGPDSPTVSKTIKGICLYMSQTGNADKLCKKINIPQASNRKTIQNALREWLFEGSTPVIKEKAKKSKSSTAKNVNRILAERFDGAMNVAELSNHRLSLLAHVDPSVISRYRSGLHTSGKNSDMEKHLSMILWQRITEVSRLRELSILTDISEDALDEALFFNWLYDTDKIISNDIYAEKLLVAFGSFTKRAGMIFPDFNELVSPDILESKAETYYGYDGIREAVIRFLGTAIQGTHKDLLLYSDQNMDWMTGDRKFLTMWAALMSECVKRGTKIQIIHNINRGLDEMCDAIISWLPIYMSGMVESYYCTQVSSGQFSHTIFLDPGNACIKAMNVKGNEDDGIYLYLTHDKELSICFKEFQRMLDNSRSLVRISTSNKTIEGDFTEINDLNLNLLIRRDLVRISLNSSPDLFLEFSHPMMCRAFREYANRLHDV